MEENQTVVLTVVPGETEAEVICGLLRANGIECGYRDTDAIDSPLDDFMTSGPREILVHEGDLQTARALLPES